VLYHRLPLHPLLDLLLRLDHALRLVELAITAELGHPVPMPGLRLLLLVLPLGLRLLLLVLPLVLRLLLLVLPLVLHLLPLLVLLLALLLAEYTQVFLH
jgi:hypothetical protein